MERFFNPFKVIERMSSFNYTGQLIITSQDITWKINLEQRKIKSSSHSLQSINNLEVCLYVLGYEEKTPKILEKMSKDGLTQEKGEAFITKAIDWLIKEENLSVPQQRDLIDQFTQDALESFFYIENISYYGCEEESRFFPLEQGFDVVDILNYWCEKQKKWEQFNSLIYSPHQRLSYEKSKNLVASEFSHLLIQIPQIQDNISIRQLGILLKLDDWQVAELIYPYLQSSILQLHSPLPPFDQLPPVVSSHSCCQINCNSDPASNKIVKTQEIGNNDDNYKKIVCIDENETTLNTVKAHLNLDNMNFYLVFDPKLALTQLFEIKPDLLLVDMEMSGMNGYHFSKIIKKSSIFQDLPIIITSADQENIKETQTQENIVNDFISKHCNEKELIRLIKKYLDK